MKGGGGARGRGRGGGGKGGLKGAVVGLRGCSSGAGARTFIETGSPACRALSRSMTFQRRPKSTKLCGLMSQCTTWSWARAGALGPG